MEVHHHSHTSPKGQARKKWTHYFWEFLMLFLAVFCGFLAEYQLEHRIEHDREKVLAKNLYKEVYNDSVGIHKILQYRDLKEKDCHWFINYVKDSNLVSLSSYFFPAMTSALIRNQYIIFEPNDGILSQLRNSGELRYFRNSELQAAIGNLGVKISYIRTRNEKEYSFIELYIRPFLLKHFDFDWYEELTIGGTKTLAESLQKNPDGLRQGKIVNYENFNRKEAEAITAYYLLMLRSTRQIQYKEFVDANHRVLELLRDKYKIN